MYIPASLRESGLKTPQLRSAILEAVENSLTEESTDRLIAALMDVLPERMPWWVPEGVVRKVLDAMLPEVLIRGLRAVL